MVRSWFMKLKNFLIICLVFSFFMAAAVIPAVAQDFDAEVFMITDFNEDVNLWPSTTDVDATEDIADFSGKPVVSATNRDVHIALEGYGRRIVADDILITYYGAWSTGSNYKVIDQIEPESLRDRSDDGCDFTIPILDNESNLAWIVIRVTDDGGNAPIYSWSKAANSAVTYPPPSGIFTPDATVWNDSTHHDVLLICNSVNLTLTSNSSDPLYLWWKESDDTAIAQSEKLDVITSFELEIDGGLDPNFTLAYTNSKYADFVEEKIKHANMEAYYDDADQLNLLTVYVESCPSSSAEYALLVPEDKGLDPTSQADCSAIQNNAKVYYEGVLINIVDVTTDTTDSSYFRIILNTSDLEIVDADVQENWTHNNSKVVVQMLVNNDTSDPIDITNDNLYVAGPDDGVGPRLLSASVSWNNARKLTLTFSESIDDDLIDGDAVNNDMEIWNSVGWFDITNATATGDNKIVVTTNKYMNADNLSDPIYVNLRDASADNIKDEDGNPAYQLCQDLKAAVERQVTRVAVVGVNQVAEQTMIEVDFDRTMSNDADVKDIDNWAVEMAAGLEEDPNGNADIDYIVYSDTNYIVTIYLNGVIESTAEEDLPGVTIVGDIIGGTTTIPATIRPEDLNVLLESNDEIGPYLVSATLDFNGETGMSAEDLILEEEVTLTLVFSECVHDADDEISSSTFKVGDNSSTPKWELSSLNKAEVLPCSDNTVVLIIDDDADDNILPYTPPAFSQFPTIQIATAADISDVNDNPATDALNEVDIDDGTDVWAASAKITVNSNGDEIIIVEFGKKVINVTSNLFNERLVSVDGDPNYVTDINRLSTKYEYEIILTEDEDDERGTDWAPTVLFDLDEDNPIEDLTATAGNNDNDLTVPFSIIPEDMLRPVLINVDPNGKDASGNKVPTLPAVQIDDDCDSSGCIYNIIVLMEFSEPMNPEIWEDPDEASDFFMNTPYSIVGFVTEGAYACGGNMIAVEIDSNNVDLDSKQLTIQIDTGSNDQFDDLNENACNDSTVYTLTTGAPAYEGIWDPANHANNNPSPSYMMLQGEVFDPNGNLMDGGFVYAVSRDKLFTVQSNPNIEDTYGEVTYGVDPNVDCYGSTVIQENGTYHIMVYGENDDTGTPGFVNGDPIILMVSKDDSSDDIEIATTACLSNAAYSEPFIGKQTPTIVPLDLNLQNREVIYLSPGWNLISTSISGVYVDEDRATASGLDAAFYSEYIYDPDMEPADLAEYNLSTIGNSRDISSLLFSIASPDLNNYIVCPLSLYNQADSLADTTNYTPVFGPGLGYYIYIDDTNAVGTNWEIVLFGEPIPGPDYMVKVNSNQELVGHWGNLLYRTPDANITKIDESRLPSTYDKDNDSVYVDDITVGVSGPGSADEFAITVTDGDGDVVDVHTVSTYFNNKDLLGPSVWFGGPSVVFGEAEDYYGLGSYYMVIPGGASWIEIDAANNGSFFVQYMVEPEEED